MTERQFNSLLIEIRSLEDKVINLSKIVDKQQSTIEQLAGKTLVISDVDETMKKLELDIKSLKDEKEM